WRILDELVQALPEAQRRCVQMYFWEGLSQTEIGRRLGIKRQSVSDYLKRAEARLRQYLEAYPMAEEVRANIADKGVSETACVFTKGEGGHVAAEISAA